jgi:hypothetical protein
MRTGVIVAGAGPGRLTFLGDRFPDFDDFPRADARRACPDGLARALYKGMHLPQVGVPTALGHVIRVTDMIPIFGTFTAKVAHLSHCHTSLLIEC